MDRFFCGGGGGSVHNTGNATDFVAATCSLFVLLLIVILPNSVRTGGAASESILIADTELDDTDSFFRDEREGRIGNITTDGS